MSALSRLVPLTAVALGLFVSLPALAQTVVIDPGHGGSDPGAVGCGLEEEDVNLDVSLRAATILRASGLTVHLTRTDDRFIELAARSSFANARGATRFVSVHSNANAGTPATGTETFVYTSPSATSRNLGQGVQNELISTWGLSNRGLKTANFSVLRRTSMPAALAELGFINRCSPDAALLGNAGERGRIATALARAILASVGRSGPTSPPPDPPPTSGTGRLLGVAFEDIGVGFEDTTRRLTGAAVRVRGTRSLDGTTSDTGAFAFDAPVGDYTIEISKSGFTTASRECTVTATDTWCSLGLTRASTPAAPTPPTTTNLRGVIYEDTGAGLTDSAPRLAGATVAVGSQTATTDASGNYMLEVTPGNLSIRVAKDGYETINRSCDAVGAESWCSIGLVSSVRAGRLQGVVYADGDLTRRVVDATITVMETGVTTRSGAGNGYWRFDLAAGDYTIRAEASGHSPQTRACTVDEGGETWCSVGLSRSGSGGSVVVDVRPIEDAATDPYSDDAMPLTGGCSASGADSSSLGWLLLLLGVVAWRRRSDSPMFSASRSSYLSAAWLPVVLLSAMLPVALAGCSGDEVGATTEALVEEALVQSDELELADEVAPFARLTSVRGLASGDYIDLELAPTGSHLALSHATHSGLSLVEVASGETRVLRESPQAGYEPLWRADGLAIGVRTPGQTSTAAPMLAFALDGSESAPIGGDVTLRVRVDNAGAVLIRHQGGAESRIAPPGDQYFEPRASADGEYVVFRGLSTGLYVHRVADGATFMIGAGSHARFDPESRYVVFERLEEDGHDVTGGTLHLLDLRHPRLRHGPVAGDVPFARAPSIAGDTVAFMGETEVFVGTLALQ